MAHITGGGLTENIIVRQARSPVIDELLEELRLNVVESVDCALRCAFRLVDVGGCGWARSPCDAGGLAHLAVHEIIAGEIPRNIGMRIRRFLQESIQGVGLRAVHIDLSHDQELSIISLPGEIKYLLIGQRLLAAELVAWEDNDVYAVAVFAI